VLIVGAGGIGTTFVDLLVPALERTGLKAEITLMDGDVVEASNLGHQRFHEEQIGIHKVSALSSRYAGRGRHVEIDAMAKI
jgi:tRNA A37 threonylcarbamoyladenosine dehydratase